MAAQYDSHLEQMDVQSAFLHGHIDKDIYMEVPEGYDLPSDKAGYVSKLLKALYGLKQSPRLWFDELILTCLPMG